MKAKTYTLTAELGSVKSTRTFQQVGDDAATFEAIGFIMDEAHLHQNSPWAIGRIVLANSKGKVLHEMESKA
jgi:hypothetical protein